MNEKLRISPYYEALGVTQVQYEIMARFRDAYWQAFGQALSKQKPDYWNLYEKFESSFSPEEIAMRGRCILHHAMLGSTPPKTNAPYVFDINGKYEAWIPTLEEFLNR